MRDGRCLEVGRLSNEQRSIKIFTITLLQENGVCV